MACRRAADIAEELRAPHVGGLVRVFGVEGLCTRADGVTVRVHLLSAHQYGRYGRELDFPAHLVTAVPEGLAMCAAPGCDHAHRYGDDVKCHALGYYAPGPTDWIDVTWSQRICPCHSVEVRVDGATFWQEAA